MKQPLTSSIASSHSPHPVHHHNIVSTSVRKQNSPDNLGLFAMLSLDLLLEIMCKLRVKSLLLLKCVCKSLNSIISDHKFSKDHLRLSQTRHYHLLICPWDFIKEREFILFDSRHPFVSTTRTTIIPETMLKFPLNPSNIRVVIIDSCDGIICFKTIDHNNKHEDIVVWNPCTNKFKILPPLENLPSISRKTLYNIGYVQFTDSCKVVAVSCYHFNESCKTEVRVHILGSNFWRRYPDFPSQLMGEPEYKGKFVGNTINRGIENKENDSSWIILSLDLGNESYQEILKPDYGLGELRNNFRLGVSRDCLCILAHTKNILDIWVMKDYGNKDSWAKLFTVPFADYADFYGYASLLYISEEDDLVYLDLYHQIHVYNYKNGTVNSHRFGGLPYTPRTFNVYVESLISP